MSVEDLPVIEPSASPAEIYRQAVANGMDEISCFRVLREVCGLSLVEAKRVIIETSHPGTSLEDHQEAFVPALEVMSMEELSTRELQAYGAACLARYCAAKSIHSQHVEWLVDHLLLVLVATRRSAWETAGTMFELAGRGEPLPPDLEERIPASERTSFERLVGSVVEIGLVDMDGAETNRPLKLARETRELLNAANVEPPSVEDLFPGRQQTAERGWGEPVAVEQYRHAREWCLRTLRVRPFGL